MTVSLVNGQPPTTGNSTANNNNFWTRAGNNQGNGGNLFGTRWNSPIYFITGGGAGQNRRMKLNGDFGFGGQYPINNYTAGVNTTGYLLLGLNNNSQTSNDNIYVDKGAFSLLHLNGEGSQYQEFGYRPWMKTGITFTGNQDLSYMGLRKLSTNIAEEDITETVFWWSDNPNNAAGPDKMVFRFSGFAGGDGATVNSNRLSSTDLDGLHVAQFTGNGLMGLGNTFGTDATGMVAGYVDPQSLLHISYDHRTGNANKPYGFMQITYRNDALSIIGSGETADDGLRFGINNDLIPSSQGPYLSGYLRWQENSPFIVQTDWDNTPGGIANGERMRITTISAPDVPDPANPFPNMTRVAISHNGSNPITQPRSLLHLGYNTGFSGTGGTPDGWRDWMDVGTFTNRGTDNMYVGLKQETGAFDDRYDAVINWGDNQTTVPGFPIGPDNLRFIFTSTTNGAGDPVSQSNDGLEVARMEPTLASTLPTTNFGMVGIGNYSPTGPNTALVDIVDAKLDIDGDLRIRTVTRDTTLTRVLVIDSTDHNRVHWTDVALGTNGLACWDLNGDGIQDPAEDVNSDGNWDALDCQGAVGPQGVAGINGMDGVDGAVGPQGPQGPAGASVNAHNGTSFSTTLPDYIAFGQNVNAGGDPGQLLNHREIPMNNNNIYFTDDNATNGTISNRIGIGTSGPLARLHIKVNPNITQAPTTGLRLDNSHSGNTSGTSNKGILNNVTGVNKDNQGLIVNVSNGYNTNTGVTVNTNSTNVGVGSNRGGSFRSLDGMNNHGVGGTASSGATFGETNTGVSGNASGNYSNIGGNYNATGNAATGTYANYGIRIHANGTPTYNIGIDSRVSDPSAPNAYAGYFVGNLHVQGQVSSTNGTIIASDQQFKQNVNDLTGAMSLIAQLQPRTFYFDTVGYDQFQFESDQQMGLIAQEVENVLPNIVSSTSTIPELDSIGVVVVPAVDYKQVEYDELIPLLIAGMQEQQSEIDSKDSLINNLNDRLTQLENCLSNILPELCNTNAMMVEDTPEATQQRLAEIIEVELRDGQNIVLNQNVPNPFAERTVITYSIPETVGKAQIHFYNGQGALINTVEINERGDGQMNVFANDLSSGVYTYSLVADGKVVATKRMVKH